MNSLPTSRAALIMTTANNRQQQLARVSRETARQKTSLKYSVLSLQV